MLETDGHVGEVLWEPSRSLLEQTNIGRYVNWLRDTRGIDFQTYESLWAWSVADLEAFWASIWEFFNVKASVPYVSVRSGERMPGVKWFVGAKLNYVEHIFRNASQTRPALIFQSEVRPLSEMSWDQLYRSVASVASALRAMGVTKGDRVVALLPNITEAVIAFLASVSLGAIWSSCSPDFGAPTIIDRFKQIEPKVLFAVDGYQYNGKAFNRLGVVSQLQESLPSLQETVIVQYQKKVGDFSRSTVLWGDLLSGRHDMEYEQVEFDHPLWILYSSGTTGLPKPIVQGHGGILLEHLKSHSLHLDLKPLDRLFWFTTTGWMMWNFIVSGLLVGSTVVLYDGSPSWPDPGALWDLAAHSGTTFFGTSAAYIGSCMKNGIGPGRGTDLSQIKAIGSTGSPLPAEGFKWVYDSVKRDAWLACISGGTDICTSLVGSCPLLPVRAGEIQCRCLGVKAEAFDEQGRAVLDQVAELVVTEPMPSMPLFFWNDKGHQRYRQSYFDTFPGVWRHGDWIKITERGSAVIYGRSDATINRHGVRMGTSEMYRVVEELPEVTDSLIVDVEVPGGSSYMTLFVVLDQNVELTQELKCKIADKIRGALSPRHVPDDVVSIPEVPRTLNGKKMEVPIKQILKGVPPERAVNPDSMSNPESIKHFVHFAETLGVRLPSSD